MTWPLSVGQGWPLHQQQYKLDKHPWQQKMDKLDRQPRVGEHVWQHLHPILEREQELEVEFKRQQQDQFTKPPGQEDKQQQ